MNSIHDLGGMDGMGPLTVESDEPVFHADWERSTFGVNMLLILSGAYLGDEHRHSMEKIEALRWLQAPYYEHWVDGLESLLIEKGVLTSDEIEDGKAKLGLPVAPALSRINPDSVAAAVATIHPVTGDPPAAPLFEVGSKVRAKHWNPKTHTRLPRYVRGHVGTVAARPGAFIYADSRGQGGPDDPQHTYTVRFESKELWGASDGATREAVYIDLYETYLEAA